MVPGNIVARSGWLWRLYLWPRPGSEPYRRPELRLARHQGIGDVLLCTPALRRLKQINPDCHVTFYTKYPSLIEGLPFIDSVRPSTEVPADAIPMTYEQRIPPGRHLAKILGDCLGFEVRDVRPSCIVDSGLKRQFSQRFRDLPHPWIIVNRHASAWTPNKDWPESYWNDLIDRLLKWSTVVEIGTDQEGAERGSDHHVNLTGQLGIDAMIAVIAAADLTVGPISGPVHIAAATGVPSVVIYGGYEHPVGTHYRGNIDLYSALPCAPCWLREPCPIDKKCLTRIEPTAVEQALMKLWGVARPRVEV
jgi:ADP-heptose:LPS heptosyltransferase